MPRRCLDSGARAGCRGRDGGPPAQAGGVRAGSGGLAGAIVDADPSNGAACYHLGRALHADGRLEQALPLHERAASFPGFEARARYNLACAHARLGHADQALAALEAAIAAGFDQAAYARTDADLESLRSDPRFEAALERVGLPLARRLNFWVGEWDCYSANTGRINGRNDLTARVGGQVIHEAWTPVGGGPGGESWNYFDPATRTWRQHWQTSNGQPFVFVGRPKQRGILYEGPHLDGRPSLQRRRMFIRPIDGGRVQQTGTQSSDGGATWRPDYDLIYLPRGQALDPERDPAPQELPRDPARDFDFLVGDWRMDVEQIGADGQVLRALSEESRVRPMIGGAALIDEWGTSGFTVRTYDPKASVWRLFWTDRHNVAGRMQTWEGRFEDGVGTFVGGVSTGSDRVTSKIEFSEISADSLFWKMWKTPDGGETWVLDYVRRYTRVSD